MPPAVRLRPIETEDVEPIARMLAHPDLVGRRGLDGDRPVSRSVVALSKAVEPLTDPQHGDAWVIDTGEPVGLAIAGWWWDVRVPWVHVVVDPGHWRRGHGSAATRLVFDHLFLDTPAMVIQYGVESWDTGGIAFADRIGGDRVGVRRRTGIRDGRYVDRMEWAVSRHTWEGTRAARR